MYVVLCGSPLTRCQTPRVRLCTLQSVQDGIAYIHYHYGIRLQDDSSEAYAPLLTFLTVLGEHEAGATIQRRKGDYNDIRLEWLAYLRCIMSLAKDFCILLKHRYGRARDAKAEIF